MVSADTAIPPELWIRIFSILAADIRWQHGMEFKNWGNILRRESVSYVLVCWKLKVGLI
jgi:hypothetical protein